MSTTDIREKLHRYIETAKDKKVKAIFAMVEEEIAEIGIHWRDETFLNELKRREKKYLKDKTTALSFDEMILRAKQTLKSAKGK